MTSTDDPDEVEDRIKKRLSHYAGRALKATGRGVKSAYSTSHVGKDYRNLGGAVLDSTVGLLGRALRGVLNTANYAARTVVGIPEGLVKGIHNKLVGHLEDDLEGKLADAEEHGQKFVTFTQAELDALRKVGADKAVPHLYSKLADAERRKGEVRLSLPQTYDLLRKIIEEDKPSHRYREVAAIISFVIALLSFDQVRLTGYAVSGATGGHDYYSLFGFLFLALATLLFLSIKERR